MRATYYLFLAQVTCLACSSFHDPEYAFLEGKWKIDGKEIYEVWEKSGDGLKGYAFRIENGKEVITETLRIFSQEGDLVYEATVPDQNEGEPIPFTLNPAEPSILSFENEDHDFPKKIQYKMISNDELYVNVLGDDGKGFSLQMVRVE